MSRYTPSVEFEHEGMFILAHYSEGSPGPNSLATHEAEIVGLSAWDAKEEPITDPKKLIELEEIALGYVFLQLEGECEEVRLGV